MISESDLLALMLSLKLASVTTVSLLVLVMPVAYWISFTRSGWRKPLAAFLSLPLILPPTVLGFYLLLAFSPQGQVGRLTQFLGIASLNFSFSGLVLGSVLFSFPFVLQPIQTAFEKIPMEALETAACLGLSPWRRFYQVVLPLSRNSVIAASILGFAHTVGEFGVVLMLGGNIPGETRVVSIALFDHVEAAERESASHLALCLLGFSFVILILVQLLKSVPDPGGKA